ncbi:MAG: tetratricopeptide repeat protein [Bacteroidota bacterium]
MLEERRAARQRAAQTSGPANTPTRGVPAPTRTGLVTNLNNSTFWAYDARTARRAMRDFTRKFGDRPLEDNWRRSGKTDLSDFESPDDNTVVNRQDDGPALVTEEEASDLLKGVPTDARAQGAMRLQLEEAIFNLGRLYRNRLGDNAKTVETLEVLHERFAKTNNEAESWYYLYLAHNDLGNVSRAEYYKSELLRKWGDTKFAKILSDPNFVNEMLNEEAQLERTYNKIYETFEAGEFQVAYNQAQAELNKLLGQHPLKPKYALLMAMANGGIQGKEAYIASLRQVVAQYANTPEQTRAKEILRLLGEGGAALPGGVKVNTGQFKPSPNELHYFIVVFDSREVDLNQSKIALSDYNNKYHKLDRLRITNVYLGRSNNVPVLVMRRFKNAEAAMKYYDGVQRNQTDFLSRTEVDYQLFPISQSNYREILKARSVEGYGDFFKENY